MFTARKKIAKDKGVEPDEFEESVAQVRSERTLVQALEESGQGREGPAGQDGGRMALG